MTARSWVLLACSLSWPLGTESCRPKNIQPAGLLASEDDDRGVLIKKTMDLVAPGKFVSVKPNIVVDPKQSYLFEIKSEIQDDKRRLVRFHFALNHFVPKGGDTTGEIKVRVNDPQVGGAKDYILPYAFSDDAFSFEYFSYLSRDEILAIKIYDIPAKLEGESIFAGADSSDPQLDLGGDKYSFYIDTNNAGQTTAVELQQIAPLRVAGKLRPGEPLSYVLAINNNRLGYNLTEDSGKPCPPGVSATYAMAGRERDISPLLKCVANGTIEFRLDYIFDANSTNRIQLTFPQSPGYFVKGFATVKPFDPTLSSVDAGDLARQALAPDPADPDEAKIEGFGKWPATGNASAVLSITADHKYDLMTSFAAHMPVVMDEATPLPDYERISAAFQGVVKIDGGSHPQAERYNDHKGTSGFTVINRGGELSLETINALIPAGTSVKYLVTAQRNSVIIDDLDPNALNSLPEGDVGALRLLVIDDKPAPYFNTKYYGEDVFTDGGVTKVGSFTDSKLPKDAIFSASRFPARAVLNAMEEIRNHIQEQLPRSRSAQRTDLNWISQETVRDCISGNEALHWSDISMHYYCQLGNARNCYTNYIREHAEPLGAEVAKMGNGQTGAKLLARAVTSGKILRLLEIKKELVKIRSEAAHHCKEAARIVHETNPNLDPRSAEAEWYWLTSDPMRENIFRFLMEAPTFAFDYDIQQRILNVFYRVSKDGTVDPNTADPKACSERRPYRAIELSYDTDSMKISHVPNSCATSKVLFKGQTAARR